MGLYFDTNEDGLPDISVPTGTTVTVYVDPVSGDNTRDGLTTLTAVREIWRAQDILSGYSFTPGSNGVIELMQGTHVVNGSLTLNTPYTRGPIDNGAVVTPYDFTITGQSGFVTGAVVEVETIFVSGEWTLSNFAIRPTGAAGTNVIQATDSSSVIRLSEIMVFEHISSLNLGSVLFVNNGFCALAGPLRTQFANAFRLVRVERGGIFTKFGSPTNGRFDFQSPVTFSIAVYACNGGLISSTYSNDLNTGNCSGVRMVLNSGGTWTSGEGSPSAASFASLPGTSPVSMTAGTRYNTVDSVYEFTTNGTNLALSDTSAGRRLRFNNSNNTTLLINGLNVPPGVETWVHNDLLKSINITASGTTVTGQTTVPPGGVVSVMCTAAGVYTVTGSNTSGYFQRLTAAPASALPPGNYDLSAASPYSITLAASAGIWLFRSTDTNVQNNPVTIFPSVGGTMNGTTNTQDQTSTIYNTRGVELVIHNPNAGTAHYVTVSGRPSLIVESDVITQIAHGFSVGQVVRVSGIGTHALAQADSPTNVSGIIGVVNSVPTLDTFTVARHGDLVQNISVTPGSVYYVSDTTPGLLTTTAPGANVKQIGIGAADGNNLYVGTF